MTTRCSPGRAHVPTLRWALGAALISVPAQALVLALALASGPAAAQPAAGPSGAPGDDLRETITLLMMVRMKKELGLSKQQYEQILPRIEEQEQERQAGFRRRRAMVDRVKDLLARDDAKDADLAAAVDKLVAQDESDRRQDEAFVGEMRKILTPRQQAQFLLFRQRFRQWLESRMRDAQELRGAGRRRLLGAGPRSRGAQGDQDDPPPDRP